MGNYILLIIITGKTVWPENDYSSGRALPGCFLQIHWIYLFVIGGWWRGCQTKSVAILLNQTVIHPPQHCLAARGCPSIRCTSAYRRPLQYCSLGLSYAAVEWYLTTSPDWYIADSTVVSLAGALRGGSPPLSLSMGWVPVIYGFYQDTTERWI